LAGDVALAHLSVSLASVRVGTKSFLLIRKFQKLVKTLGIHIYSILNHLKSDLNPKTIYLK
jgi:hypothetical protein